jgi:spermidine synthase
MIPWEFLGSARAPGDGEELSLYRRGNEFSIRVKACQLMGSTAYGSEEALAELVCARLAGRLRPRILIGGLGMGYTVGAALRHLGADSEVVVAELVQAVVDWNRGPLADLAGRPLEDPRVTVRVIDVARVLRTERDAYDAVLLDVDNGPEGLTRKGNNWLYAQVGLEATQAALRSAGLLGVWSSHPNRAFTRRLRHVGFTVEEVSVRARGQRGGPQHLIWLAQRSA